MKIAVAGACGKMGSRIVRRASLEGMQVVALFEREDHPGIGKNAKEIIGIDMGLKISGAESIEEVLKKTGADVFVDFTRVDAARKNIEKAANANVDMVIGTTGFIDEDMKRFEELSREKNFAMVVSPNMAVGVNLLFKISSILSKSLKGYDIEIVEMHHREKLDAPSGTAKKIAEIIAESLGKGRESIRFGRGQEYGKRDDCIYIHALRGGDIFGDHTVIFAGNGERIEITHRATSRDAFVSGVIRAIRWVKNAKKGKVYSMFDVLEIEM